MYIFAHLDCFSWTVFNFLPKHYNSSVNILCQVNHQDRMTIFTKLAFALSMMAVYASTSGNIQSNRLTLRPVPTANMAIQAIAPATPKRQSCSDPIAHRRLVIVGQFRSAFAWSKRLSLDRILAAGRHPR